MPNDITNIRLWKLDSIGVIAADHTAVVVRKLVYLPAAVDDDVTIQEYQGDGTLIDTIIMKADHAAAEPFEMDFGPEGRLLNGFKLSVIDGGTLYVYVGLNNLFA